MKRGPMKKPRKPALTQKTLDALSDALECAPDGPGCRKATAWVASMITYRADLAAWELAEEWQRERRCLVRAATERD